ncbi:hypothetical protein [Lentzea waywayandensis]|nr:hypothetical protein [Lentzea waywayandensis]
MSNDNDLDVPIGWLCADHVAGDLLVYADPGLSPACFEYRVTHSVLALTMFVADVPTLPGRVPAMRLASMRHRLSSSWEWGDWCANSLQRCMSGNVAAESLRLARSALHWLEGGRLVAQLDRTNRWGIDGAVQLPEGGADLGVTHARRVLDVHLRQR